MIKKIVLNKITLLGFRKFKEEKVIEFKEGLNIITGKNTFGKSTIGFAIAWLLTGQNVEGKKNDLGVVNDESTVASVELEFVDEFGKVRTLSRRMTPTTVVIKLDGVTVSQKALDAQIDTGTFLSIFNPLMYLDYDSQKMREYLLKHAEEIGTDEVLSQLDESTKKHLVSYFGDTTVTNVLLAIEETKVTLRKMEQALEVKRIALSNAEQEISLIKFIPEGSYDENLLLAKENELITLRSSIPVLDVQKAKDYNLKKEEIRLIEKKHQELEKESLDLLSKKQELEQVIKKVSSEVFVWGKQGEDVNIKATIARLTGDYHEAKAGAIEMSKALKILEGIEDKSEIAGAITVLLGVKHSFDERMNAIIAEGGKAREREKELADDKVASEEAWEKSANEKMTALKISLRDVEGDILRKHAEESSYLKSNSNRLKELREDVMNMNFSQYADAIEAKKLEIEKQVQPLVEEIALLKGERDRVEELILTNKANQLKKQEKVALIESLLKEIELKKEDVQLKSDLYESLIKYQIKKSELTTKSITALFKNVSFVFEKFVKSTGEFKPCLEIYYEGRSLNKASTSQIIKVGLEISSAISRLSESVFPVFIDNGESISEFDTSSFKQMIYTVVNKDSDFTISYEDGSEVSLQASSLEASNNQQVA